MSWQWWVAIAIYAAGAVGGMSYVGVWYQRKVERVRAEQDASPLTIRLGVDNAGAMAWDLSVAAILWPVASLLVVLYYGITAPFWLGKRIESRKAERRRALAKQHRAQADNLRHMAQDYGRGTTERQILLDGAQHLVDKADTIK